MLWGSTYLGIRVAIEAMPPLLMAGTRYMVAGGLLYGVMRLLGNAPAPTATGWRNATLIGGGLLLFGNGGVTLAEQYVPTGMASLLIATVPMFMAVLGWWWGLAPRPSALAALGLVIGMGGVWLLARSPVTTPVPHAGHALLGVGLLLGGALVWSATSLFSRSYPASSSQLVGVGMQMFCGGLLMAIVALLKGEAADLHLSSIPASAWLAWAYLIVLGSIVGFTAYVWLLSVVEPALVGTYAFVNPVVAVLLGWGFMGERLTSSMLSGAALIVAAVALVVLGGRRKPTAVAGSPASDPDSTAPAPPARS